MFSRPERLLKRLPPSPSRDGSSEEDDEFHSNVKINFLTNQDNIVPSIISYGEGQSVSGSDLDTPTYTFGMNRAGNDCSSMNSLSDKDASKKSLKMPSNENFFKLIANYNANRKDSGKSNKLSSSNSDDNCTKSKQLKNTSNVEQRMS